MRQWIRTVAAVLILGLSRPAMGAADGPINLDFEQGKAGEAPLGWFVPTEGFKAVVSGDSPSREASALGWREPRTPKAPRPAI